MRLIVCSRKLFQSVGAYILFLSRVVNFKWKIDESANVEIRLCCAQMLRHFVEM
jgi:hypothetical protein